MDTSSKEQTRTLTVELKSPPVDAEIEDAHTLLLTLAAGTVRRITLPLCVPSEEALRLVFDKATG